MAERRHLAPIRPEPRIDLVCPLNGLMQGVVSRAGRREAQGAMSTFVSPTAATAVYWVVL
jgi:hypothetical protein